MSDFVAVFASETLLLLARWDDAKSLAMLQATAEKTGHKVYEFQDLRGFLLTMGDREHIIVPVFDHCSNRLEGSPRRYLRLVHRNGHAMFPPWVPQSLDRAVMVYRIYLGFTREIQAKFPAWASKPPRSARSRVKNRTSSGLNLWDHMSCLFC